jgi:hypothetical protein
VIGADSGAGGHYSQHHDEHGNTDWDDGGQFKVSAKGNRDRVCDCSVQSNGALSGICGFTIQKKGNRLSKGPGK